VNAVQTEITERYTHYKSHWNYRQPNKQLLNLLPNLTAKVENRKKITWVNVESSFETFYLSWVKIESKKFCLSRVTESNSLLYNTTLDITKLYISLDFTKIKNSIFAVSKFNAYQLVGRKREREGDRYG